MDRIAGHTALYHGRRGKVLLKIKVEIEPGTRERELVDCCLTDRYLLLESKRRLQIPLSKITGCYLDKPYSPEALNRVAVSQNMVKLGYFYAAGQCRVLDFVTGSFEAGSLIKRLSFISPRPGNFGRN